MMWWDTVVVWLNQFDQTTLNQILFGVGTALLLIILVVAFKLARINPAPLLIKYKTLDYSRFNYGALIFTELWLWSNGFWGRAISLSILKIVLIKYYALVAVIISLVVSVYYGVFGNQISWRDGARWNYDTEYFKESQVFLEVLALLVVAIAFIILLVRYVS